MVWEFHVHKGLEPRFERAYGPDGDWAVLFRQDPEYCGTELVRDSSRPGRYLTLDYWTNEAAYEAFRKAHVAQYKQIDENCEQMTVQEREIGKFLRVTSEPSSP